MDDPITAGEIAKLLGITRQGVDYLVKNDDTFPAPAVVTPVARVWERADIERWARETGRIE